MPAVLYFSNGFRVKPGMFLSPFLRKQESSRLWYRHGFRVKPGMVKCVAAVCILLDSTPENCEPALKFGIPFLRKQESTRLWYRHGFRVKPGMATVEPVRIFCG